MSEQNAATASRNRRGDSGEYWQALSERRLIIPQCLSCGETYFYPRPFCPFCMSDDIAWVSASGKGTVYSFTTSARAPQFKVPAMVTLDEGPTLMTAIEGIDPASVFIGQKVEVVFAELADGTVVPVFAPVAASVADGKSVD